MRRRQFVGAATGALATGLAGCAMPGAGSRHVFADGTTTVRIVSESDSDHDLVRNARESLEYWEAHSMEYVDFPVEFAVVDDENPDISIEYVDEPSRCETVENYSERVLGCAPVIRPGQRFRGTATAIVVAGARPFGKIKITTKHEIGHILGLGHDDDPQDIMSNRPELRIPMYELRIAIWETVLAAHERTRIGSQFFGHGVDTWNEQNYEAAEGAFEEATDTFAGGRADLDGARDRAEEFAGDPRVETVDLDGVRSKLDTLVRRMELAEGFSSAMTEAARAASADDGSTASARLEEANEGIREFSELASPELRDVAIALGLVRGFDRDEPVVDVEDDEEIDDEDIDE